MGKPAHDDSAGAVQTLAARLVAAGCQIGVAGDDLYVLSTEVSEGILADAGRPRGMWRIHQRRDRQALDRHSRRGAGRNPV